MTDQHITRDLLDACERGDVSQEALTRHLLRHLQGSCETCRRELARWRKRRNPRRHAKPLLQTLLQERFPDAPERQAAERDFLTLFPLGSTQRERKIARARTRFRSPLLARLLVEEAITEWTSDVEEASTLIDSALQVLDRSVYSSFGEEVRVLARAARAFTYKIQGDLDRAEPVFVDIRRTLRTRGLVDLGLAAQVDELEGSFWRDRRRLERSRDLLLRAIGRYRLLRDELRLARALLVIGNTYFYAGDVTEAMRSVREAFDLAPESEMLRAMAGHNLVLYLLESGRLEDAVRRFGENLPRYRKVRDAWRLCDLHFHWLAGKLRRAQGRLAEAKKHLLHARNGFVERGTAYDAILVCLDLALVYDAQGRYEDLEELSELMVRGLDAVSLHEEATAALVLLAKAARRRTMDQDLVRRISHFLQFSLKNPSLRCDIRLPESDGVARLDNPRRAGGKTP